MIGAANAKSPRDERILSAALLLLLAVVWLEPAGSGLAEPDETRYAEIPREMLAAGDLLVPRLNGVPYFEKPPLLYWLNAASLRSFGQTPWAARLPTRCASLGTTLLVILAAARRMGRRGGLSAGILFLASPMGFLFSRANLTDGLLTFFFTATVLAGNAAVRGREAGHHWKLAAAAAGAGAAGAFLSKGLIGLVLPGLILLLWCLATGRFVHFIPTFLFSSALPVFLGLSVPWFLLVESRHPGFLQFFFVQEHFQRFATTAAKRPGPIFYFVPVFLLGFLPGLPFFFSAVKRFRGARREDEDLLFLLLWFAVVFVFFSLSRSKLPPYLFPAIPAAAALSARGIPVPEGGSRRLWSIQAILATALVLGILAHPGLRASMAKLHLGTILIPTLAGLLAGSWIAAVLARRGTALALAAVAAGWASLLAGVALGWPKLPQAKFTAELAAAAQSAAVPRGAPIVAYRDYVNGISWELKSPIPVAAYRGELEPEFEEHSAVREALFWSDETFWASWGSRPLVALVRTKDLSTFARAVPAARIVRQAEGHAIVANFSD
ncbi:MAG TPA: glycosyltransferase family 39 protein [Thermoanaerobaculia bacterium]